MADCDGKEVVSPKKPDVREDRVRVVRERQAEERLRRLEELKQQALETQQLREQREADRRRRIEEQRAKENERRSQVEERKKQINEVERERREAILRKNQERDARMEIKRRNERSSIVFAFGSSTPRLLETSDSHMTSSFWGTRRATSTANLRLLPTANSMSVSMIDSTRRPTERETAEVNWPKKRAASAGGLYRRLTCSAASGGKRSISSYEVFHWDAQPKNLVTRASDCNNQGWANGEECDSATVTTTTHVSSVYRRKTDLMPTTPSPRDSRFSSRPSSGTRSLARTPGRAHSLARLDTAGRVNSSSVTTPISSAMSRSTTHLAGSLLENKMPKRDASKSMVALWRAAPVLQPRTTRAERLRNRARARSQQNNSDVASSSSGDATPSRPGSVLSSHNSSLMTSSVHSALQPRVRSAPPARKARPLSIHVTGVTKTPIGVEKSVTSPTVEEKSKQKEIRVKPAIAPLKPKVAVSKKEVKKFDKKENESQEEVKSDEGVKSEGEALLVDLGAADETVKTKAGTLEEEEARAKLAERRRLAREQAEREAEAERLRVEQAAKEEADRLKREEEEQRKAEEEMILLAEEARKAEEMRLMVAIQEAQKKEEEEKLRRQQEEQARLEKEEAEKIAREEAEKQRLEMAERLRKEEEERQARRKRVEAIMKRTRNAGPTNSNPKAECEKGEEDRSEKENPDKNGTAVNANGSEKSTTGAYNSNDSLEAFLHGERVNSEQLLLTNGHKNSIIQDTNHLNQSSNGLGNQDCVVETPLIKFQGTAKETPIPPDLLA